MTKALHALRSVLFSPLSIWTLFGLMPPRGLINVIVTCDRPLRNLLLRGHV